MSRITVRLNRLGNGCGTHLLPGQSHTGDPTRWDGLLVGWVSMYNTREVFRSRSSNFWSASSNANNPDNAWKVNFNNGNDNANNKSNNNRVRLVRGGE